VGHCLSVFGIALALALSQPQTPQRFKSSIDVVQVDVSAVDGNGRPIRDLTARDFEVRVDRPTRAVIAIGSRDVGRVTRPFRIPKAAANPHQ
jgi:hypothetical protein